MKWGKGVAEVGRLIASLYCFGVEWGERRDRIGSRGWEWEDYAGGRYTRRCSYRGNRLWSSSRRTDVPERHLR